ncbi:hypothetical protein EVAR_12208_1 [Eumeta japonica]|uniref:Uncharacterized protein n=1 Tax=Eumeta variegata TaxID=151549 RepID=A0A4C1UH48_EUMVA|nr:hypothetical protein EVAR_12208_1 [Eumeta japonica]
MLVKVGYGRRKIKVGQCGGDVIAVECLGNIDVETVMLESGVVTSFEGRCGWFSSNSQELDDSAWIDVLSVGLMSDALFRLDFAWLLV